MMFWRRIALILVLPLVMSCAHQGLSREEHVRMSADQPVPAEPLPESVVADTVVPSVVDKVDTIDLETVPEESLPLPAPLVQEPLRKDQDEPVVAESAPEVKPEPAIIIVRATPVVRMSEPGRELGDLQYVPNPYEGKTQRYQPKRGDSVAKLGQAHFPGIKLSWVAGTFCHLNPNLVQSCTEEEFRRLPADRAWIFPAWTVKSDTLANTIAKSREAIRVDDQVVLKAVREPKESVVSEADPSPVEQDGQVTKEEATSPAEEESQVSQATSELPLPISEGPVPSDPWFPTGTQLLWGIILLILAFLALYAVRKARARRRGDRRNLRWGS